HTRLYPLSLHDALPISTVDLLAEAGCPVGVVDLDGAAAERTAQKVKAAGGKAVAIRADIREESEVQGALETVKRELGSPTLSARSEEHTSELQSLTNLV